MTKMKDCCIKAYVAGNKFQVADECQQWELLRYGDLEELWEAMGSGDPDERIPYWTELWPASLALGEWLKNKAEDIKGKICLDLGCGLGFTAIVGQQMGAKMLAIDYEAAALEYCRLNAANNNAHIHCLAMDWRAPALTPGCLKRLWGADVIYEKRFIQPILDLLDYVLAENGLAWIAEPGRAIFDLFKRSAADRGFKVIKSFSCLVADPNSPSRKINSSVWELSRQKDSCLKQI